MADEFDRFLASSLAPPERLPDLRFVSAMQMRIVLEDRVARHGRGLRDNLLRQMLGLSAVAAGIAVLSNAAPVAEWSARSPALGLATLLIGFLFVIAVLSGRPVEPAPSSRL
jgi:hypothetical protein